MSRRNHVEACAQWVFLLLMAPVLVLGWVVSVLVKVLDGGDDVE